MPSSASTLRSSVWRLTIITGLAARPREHWYSDMQVCCEAPLSAPVLTLISRSLASDTGAMGHWDRHYRSVHHRHHWIAGWCPDIPFCLLNKSPHYLKLGACAIAPIVGLLFLAENKWDKVVSYEQPDDNQEQFYTDKNVFCVSLEKEKEQGYNFIFICIFPAFTVGLAPLAVKVRSRSGESFAFLAAKFLRR